MTAAKRGDVIYVASGCSDVASISSEESLPRIDKKLLQMELYGYGVQELPSKTNVPSINNDCDLGEDLDDSMTACVDERTHVALIPQMGLSGSPSPGCRYQFDLPAEEDRQKVAKR